MAETTQDALVEKLARWLHTIIENDAQKNFGLTFDPWKNLAEWRRRGYLAVARKLLTAPPKWLLAALAAKGEVTHAKD